MMKIQFTVLAILLAVIFAAAQQKKIITPEQAFKNGKPSLQVRPPIIYWLDSVHYFFQRNDGNEIENEPHIVNASTGKSIVASDEAMQKFKDAEALEVISKDNDIFLSQNGKEIQLTNDDDVELNATLSPDNRLVAFTKNNNLYCLELAGNKITQLTFDGSDLVLNGYLSWVYMEEILGRSTMFRGFWWSPDSRKILFYRSDDSPVPVYPIFNYEGVSGSLTNTRYPQPGDDGPFVKIGLADVKKGAVAWLPFDTTIDQYFGTPVWNHQGTKIYLTWINRDQNTLKVYTADAEDLSLKQVYEEKQKAWIAIDKTDIVTPLKGNDGFILASDKNGWMNLTWFNAEGKIINEITTGRGDVTEIIFVEETYSGKSAGRNRMFFLAQKESPLRTDLYSVQLDGKNMKRLTFGSYSHRIDASGNASYFISYFSNHSDPGAIALVDRKGYKTEIYNMHSDVLKEYTLPIVEMLTVKSSDGLFDLPVKITYPSDFDSSKKYPLLINVYGGPGAKNISDSWSLTPTTIWWAQENIVQVTIDHRGSGQFGKRGEEYMYRNLGKWEMEDYSTVVKFLMSKGWVNERKVCIMGSSYGGYMACLALTKASDVFTHGVAMASVTDWLLYDNIYTERYMDLPEENVEGYKNGSVLTFADKYKGHLLLVHGTSDDNVHIQNTLQLVKEIQERKKNFDLMIYPSGKHGWGGNQGIHYRNLTYRYIYENILEKSIPEGVLK